LLAALDSGDDVLAALVGRFSNDRAADIQPFLDEHGVPYKSWSMIGE
jgi:hypothetical protein